MSTATIYWSPQASGGAAPVPEQGVQIEVLDPQLTGLVDTTVALLAGPSQQIGAVPLADWLVRTDDANEGTQLKITQAGIYEAQFFLVPATTGVAGIMIGVTLDAPPALLVSNPDMIGGNTSSISPDFYFGLPATQTEAQIVTRTLYVSEAMAADPNLAIVRPQISDVLDAPPAPFTILLTEVALRIDRTGDAE